MVWRVGLRVVSWLVLQGQCVHGRTASGFGLAEGNEQTIMSRAERMNRPKTAHDGDNDNGVKMMMVLLRKEGAGFTG